MKLDPESSSTGDSKLSNKVGKYSILSRNRYQSIKVLTDNQYNYILLRA